MRPGLKSSGDARDFLNNLNPVQREAVLHTQGPLLIFAGAGSGKTRVITYRIAHLIIDLQVPPFNILAVTFTNKAATEMRDRVFGLVGEAAGKGIYVGTFHSICARILREFHAQAGLERDFVVYDDSDQIAVVKRALTQLNLDEKKFTPRSILHQISRAKEKMIRPEEWHDHFSGFMEDITGKVFGLYAATLKSSNALDFDDLLTETVYLLQRSPEVLARLQKRYAYIHVDEYQDVNLVQYKLIDLLAQKSRNLCVVGDDDQSVYSWRGAAVELILRFEQDYPDAKVLKLEQNYRSTGGILEAAYAVVRHNPNRRDKKLWTENAYGVPLVRYEAENEHQEAEWIVRQILDRIKAGSRKWSDFAVLYRTNAQSRVLEDMLRQWNIPYRIVGGTRFYDRKEVKDAIAYLRVYNNPQDSVSIRRVINNPVRGIGDTTLKRLEEDASLTGSNLWSSLINVDIVQGVSTRGKSSIHKFTKVFLDLKERSSVLTLPEILTALLTESGYMEALAGERTIEAEGRIENLNELLRAAIEFQAESEAGGVTEFLESVSLVSDIDALDAGANAIVLMTLHSAKGLEFPVVFMAGMEETICPHARSMESDVELEEERRLCYVGITRAQEELLFTYARRRSSFQGIAFNPVSRFLHDIPDKLFDEPKRRPTVRSFDPDDDSDWKTTRSVARLWTDAPIPPAKERRKISTSGSGLRVGQRVKHAHFGTGVVLNVVETSDDTTVEIAFAQIGPKKLLLSLTKLDPVN